MPSSVPLVSTLSTTKFLRQAIYYIAPMLCLNLGLGFSNLFSVAAFRTVIGLTGR
jgi:hypothetical protein